MSLVERNGWWIVPGFLLAIFMVFAMMEFTITLTLRRPPRNRKPVSGDELRQRLLALNKGDRPYRIVEVKDCDLELNWDVVDKSWYEIFAKVKLTVIYRARALLDEAQHEVRWFEMVRWSNFFLGFDGWRPRFNWSIYALWGYIDVVWTGIAYGIQPGFPPRIGRVYKFSLNTIQAKKEIRRVVNESGWTFRPVLWWFQVNRNSYGAFQALMPNVSARRFWGILYPVSYFFTIGYIIYVADPKGIGGLLSLHNLTPVLLFSALWWGIWGFIAWIFSGFPPFWRRFQHPSSRHKAGVAHPNRDHSEGEGEAHE